MQTTLPHTGILLCRKAEPDALLRAENEALQDEVQHLRLLLSLAAVSVNSGQYSASKDTENAAQGHRPPSAAQLSHSTQPGTSFDSNGIGHKPTSLCHGETGTGRPGAKGHSGAEAAPIHPSGTSSAGTWSAIVERQLQREELLKWKAAQLERQVLLLQAALQVHTSLYCCHAGLLAAKS